MENLLYPLLSFIPALLNAGILIYILFYAPREKTTDLFSFVVLTLLLWQTEDTIMRLCTTAESALFWDRLLCVGWAGFAPVVFHFACRYTERRVYYSRYSLLFIYVPFILLYLVYTANSSPTEFFRNQAWGWILKPRAGTLDGLHRLLISVYVIAAEMMLFHYAFSINNKQKKLQAFFIAGGMLIPMLQGIATQIVFPLILNRADIPVTSSFMTFFSVATILSIRRYGLFNIADVVNVEKVLDNLKNFVFVLSPGQQIMYSNHFAREVLRTERTSTGSIETFFPAPVHYHAFVEEVIKPSLTGRVINGYTTSFITVAGKKMDVLVFAEPVISNKQVQGLLIVANDVSELSRTVHDLKNSNKELERFVYVASHDLQEPLRKVSYFLQLLSLRYKDNLDEAANGYIDAAVNSAAYMRMLISDLLEYSYVTSSQENRGIADMNVVAENVIKTLALQIEDAGARLHVGPLPVVHRIDETQMHQLLQNLVSNALKYRSERHPSISIYAEDEGEYWRFAVKDNGIGIEPQHREKVFAVFQRLHNKNQYPGTGVGLSICKKIVDKCGGRIWIESNTDGGCTFFFTLPNITTHLRLSEAVAEKVATSSKN